MPNWEGDNEIRLNDAMITVDDSAILVKDRDELQSKKRFNLNISNYLNNIITSFWKTNGNSGTNQSVDFIGTIDNVGVSFRTNNVIRQTITNTGNIGVNTTTPTSNLHINGSEAGSITNITATTTLNGTHHKILVSNGATNITITLPNALTCLGREYVFSRASGSTGSITITGGAGNQMQALAGTVGATTSISLHTATGGGLNIRFTAINIGGIGTWVRL